MIDEKKIEEAAEKASISYSEGRYENLDFQDGFKAGISWFLGNLWHEASEEPKVPNGEPCITCLVKFKNASTELCTYWSTSNEWICDEMCHKDFVRNFDSWLYIEDLLKGNK